MPGTNASLASTIIGSSVRDSAGQIIGRVEDLIIDHPSDTVHFAILSLGFPGFGDRLFAIPLAAVNVLTGRDYVLLEVDKNLLERAPWFDRNHWPDTLDPAWRSQIYRYYGRTEPLAVADRPVVVRREYVAPPARRSAAGAVVLALVIVLLLGFTYMVTTKGWDQTRTEVMNSFEGVTYAMKETSQDAALTTKVKTALSLNKYVSARDINVDSSDGVVTLRGQVQSEEARNIALQTAQDTPGVREVHDQLTVLSH